VRGSPAWREKEDLLSSVPSVGPAISRTLIAELPELGTLDRKEIAALVGLAPFARQSGQWRQDLHWRGEDERAQNPVHGRYGRRATQPGAESLL